MKLDVFIKIPFLRKVPSHKMALNYRYLIILCPNFIIYKMGMIFVERKALRKTREAVEETTAFIR